jgi:DNA-directed RNA polymerase subunit alpha
MPQTDPLDTVIGLDETQRDARAAARHLEAARTADNRGDRESAIAEYRRAIQADPVNTEALFELAYRLDLAGEEDEALALYEHAAEQPPAAVHVLINLAIMYEDRGEYGRAERCLRQVLETQPNHPRARLYMKDVQASRETGVEEEGDRDLLRRRQLLDTPITDTDLSVRARTALKKLNIRTIGDLIRTTEAELIGTKNFGEASLTEIKKMLAAKGLRLGQGMEEGHRQSRRHQVADQLKNTGKEALLAKPVTDIPFSVRARRALQLLNIQTIGDLASHTEAELMGVKNFGATSLTEVKERLGEHGLSLRTVE